MSEPRRKPLYSFFADSLNTASNHVPSSEARKDRASTPSQTTAPKPQTSERPQPKYYNPATHTVHSSSPSAFPAPSETRTEHAPHQESRHHPAPFIQSSRRHFVPSGPAPQHQSQHQHHEYAQPAQQAPAPQHQGAPANGSSANVEELTRIFNSALVSSRAESLKDFSHELLGLVESPAYQAIINAVRQLARSQAIGERESAEILIQTFRKLDRLWSDYVFQEGVDRLRGK